MQPWKNGHFIYELKIDDLNFIKCPYSRSNLVKMDDDIHSATSEKTIKKEFKEAMKKDPCTRS